MRILFITDKFLPECGGSQIIFGNLYAHLQDHEVTVVTRACPESRAADEEYRHRIVRVPFSRIPKVRSVLLWQRLYQAARRLLDSEHFDQVHLGQPFETAPFGTILAKQVGLPCLVHTFAEDVTSHLHNPLYAGLMRQALLRAEAVTTISRYTREHLLRLGVEEDRIILMYPGLTPQAWEPTGREATIRARFGLQDKRVLLTVSRLIARKGHDIVLRALPLILEIVPQLAYVVVGTGPEELRLRTLAREIGVSEHVHWAGSVPNQETVDYYHASDLFVMPNRQLTNGEIEGFGLVFLEANACGLPVVGGRSGGAVDAIDDGITGCLVEPTSPAEVAEAIIGILTRPAFESQLGEAGRRRALAEFTWTASADTLRVAMEMAEARFKAERAASK